MEPRIQYAKTTDGVNIAYWVIGSGLPLVYLPNFPFSHVQVEWEIADMHRWYECLAEKTTLIRYDPRGSGLSDRDVVDFSLESFGLDLQAVADRLGLEQFALFAGFRGGPIAVAYAARHPERVSHLLLWNSYARVSDYLQEHITQVFFRLLDDDWETFTETLSHTMQGWSQGESAHRFAAFIRESVTPEFARAFFIATRNWDTTDLLAEVRSPTLVLHRRQLPTPPVRNARALASGIPNARLALLEGASSQPFLGDVDAVLDAIGGCLGEDFASAKPRVQTSPASASILFADIVDSTALTERLGDAAFRAKARDLDTALRSVIRENSGTPIEGKLLGDGVLAVFTSARQAIEAAVACGEQGSHAGLPLHLGIHAGDVIREEDPDGRDNVYGGAVNIASRISGLSAPGEVLVSETVRSLARTSAGVRFEDRGEQALKGVREAVRVWAVVADASSPSP